MVAQVQFLVGVLRSCKPGGVAKKIKEREKEKKKYAEEKIKKSKIFEKEFLGCLAILGTNTL